jgi:nucleotide-binding universal stress UspA family protein
VSGIRRVIVGASGSAGSLPALRQAVEAARQDDALLVAVHAWVPPGGELADRRYPSPYLRRMWADAAADRLEAALLSAWGGVPAEVEFQPMVVRGQAGHVLVELAESAGDLLVVGAGRRGRLARLRHGQVSRYCLARARCPVLIVPPAAVPRRRLRPWPARRWQLTGREALTASAYARPGRDKR